MTMMITIITTFISLGMMMMMMMMMMMLKIGSLWVPIGGLLHTVLDRGVAGSKGGAS